MPLEGVRIADFTRDLAGAHCPGLLAQLGAQVIKVETPRFPDPTRFLARFFGWSRGASMEGLDGSAEFSHLNLNKLGITLNLRHPQGVELAKALVRVSDVVTENFRPGVMARLGLGYPALCQVKPDLIMLSTCGWGATGPDKDYAAYAPIFAAAGGLSHISGYEDGPPVTVRTLPDASSAAMAAFAVMTALIHRQATGQGQHIDYSSVENIICLTGDVIAEYSLTGQVPGRCGNRDEQMAPHNTYRCQGEDRWVSIAVATEEEWRALGQALGHPEWAQDERFRDAPCRRQHLAELDRLIEAWTQTKTPHEVMEVLQGAGVAAVPVFNTDQLYHDPQVKARGCYLEMEQEGIGKHAVLQPPFHLSATPARIVRPGPRLGEHNRYILGELLGLGEEEIGRLGAEGILE